MISSFPINQGLKMGTSVLIDSFPITHDIYKSLNNELEIRGVFLDITEAFGKFWHGSLLNN